MNKKRHYYLVSYVCGRNIGAMTFNISGKNIISNNDIIYFSDVVKEKLKTNEDAVIQNISHLGEMTCKEFYGAEYEDI